MSAISQFAGMRLYATERENDRREGTRGRMSLAIILRCPGILYEDFIKAGGRSNDLRHDVGRGIVVAREGTMVRRPGANVRHVEPA